MQNYEKAKLFSETVAAEAEANSPVIKEDVKHEEGPLHFKYYSNDEVGDSALTESEVD